MKLNDMVSSSRIVLRKSESRMLRDAVSYSVGDNPGM